MKHADKFYEWEYKRFEEFTNIELPIQEQLKVLDELCSKYNVEKVRREDIDPKIVEFIVGKYFCVFKNDGTHKIDYYVIQLKPKAELATIIHEFTHHLTNQQTPDKMSATAHGSKFKSNLIKVYKASEPILARYSNVEC